METGGMAAWPQIYCYIENVELGVGDVVMWPSVFLYPHEVTPVTKGTRITAVMWGW